MTASDEVLAAPLQDWLTANTPGVGPWRLRRLSGGNSNETCLLTCVETRYVLRRPPRNALSASAHNLEREHRVLGALSESAVPAPRPVALCENPAVPMAPFLVMEHVPDAVSVTTELPAAYPGGPSAVARIAEEVVDALAAVHGLDWGAAGLDGFGKPARFLERQVPRWYRQWQSIARRPLPALERVADWLERNRPDDAAPALLHGDFHLDNCLVSAREPRLLAVIDWEMATIGDPLLDLGLLLAFWGERPVDPPGMPAIQAVSRAPGAPPREALLDRYEQAIGRPVRHVTYYRCLALFKLAAIVEAARSQRVAGDLDTPYARALEYDVPALLDEAAAVAGIATRAGATSTAAAGVSDNGT
ncbi:putative kinase, aminoglycoside phosphotransferase (APT) family [Prauserella aidingensis]|uniref:phosphotransferase family protein n=1 Tax=Prauserella aidingensis TaxID=387890 RepID=UPI0020A50B64|nr:phosphotransferase family protein [Prauserella aidingensis]MCP2253780.1 putative kinase, aminoglycoside phosphotransferase (APT) family [Prauserella aidingensis]